jgi:carbamoyltransferase
MGFAELYSLCAETLGFNGRGREQRMEALARSQGPRGESPVVALFDVERDRLRVDPAWRVRVREMLEKGAHTESIRLAQALQHRIADLAIELLASMRERYPEFRHLCAGGSLFFNSHFNARLKLHGQFDDVFVPPNPGNAGIAVGAALHAAGPTRIPVSPFSGPAYSPEEIKGTLDNCKLTYQWASENETVAIAAQALYSGCLVAWFDGPMEWGTRALGNRSILANPFHPFVLENLNTFLKQREAWRGYALSGPTTVVREHFDGPASSPYMECDYQPKDPKRFRHVLPGDGAAVRIQTVGAEGPERFRALLDAFGRLSGLPMLVNTSFNGFREPIVCSPRDAIRVFYGTGADLLVLGHFVLRK